MRRTIGVMALMLLGACNAPVGDGNSGDAFSKGFHDSFRPKFIEQCVSGAASKAPPGLKVDFTPICGCAADKMMARYSATQLMSGPPDGEAKQIIEQCAKEHPFH
jgi:hypothetical protein